MKWTKILQKKKQQNPIKKVERNWDKIFVSENPNLVDLFIQLLEEKNIKSVAINKKDSSYTIFGNIELYVKNTDMEKSKEIIDIYHEQNS
jgi:hypothetical protein